MVGGGRVFGFDGERQSFNGAQVQAGDFLDMNLVFLQPVQIQLVRAVDEVDQREQNQRGVPGILAASAPQSARPRTRRRGDKAESRNKSDTRFGKSICVGERDDAGNQNRIDDEVGAGGETEEQWMEVPEH